MKIQFSYLFGKWYWWDKRGDKLVLRNAHWLNNNDQALRVHEGIPKDLGAALPVTSDGGD